MTRQLRTPSTERCVTKTRIPPLLVVTISLFCLGCLRLSRVRQDAAVDVAETECRPETVLGRYALQSTQGMREASVETLELRQSDCGFELRAQQEWALGHSEVAAAFDRQRRVQRVWKRNTMPGRGDVSLRTDLRVFRIRDSGVVLRQRRPHADIENFVLRGRVPTALVAPGRLSLTMWLQRANLAVGGRVREPVLDARERVELLRDVTLMRLADSDVDGLGRVRVYTIYGREPIYADAQNVVVGDMMGMRSMEQASVRFRLVPAGAMNPSLVP